jgi:hypothetical protein
MLGARYERLMSEARSAGVTVLPPLSPFESQVFRNTELGTRSSAIATIAESMIGARDVSERSRRALRLLCESRGARGGHLFLGSESELRLMASHAAEPPDAALERDVAELWAQQFEDLDMDTAQLSTDGGGEATAARPWTDRAGTVYQPLLLSGSLDHTLVRAGVALLIEPDGAPRTTTSMQLVSELAGFLARWSAHQTKSSFRT